MMINKKIRKGFTFIEMLFVIVIMGILAKFGVEFIAQSYNSFIFSKINNQLQSNSASAVEFISKRLEHRIKKSVIYRNPEINNDSNTNYKFLGTDTDSNATVLEWIATDIDGYRGDGAVDYWSGVLDLNKTNKHKLVSLRTDTENIKDLIEILSDNNSTISDAAIYFVGGDTVNTFDGIWGWDGNTTMDENQSQIEIHPIDENSTDVSHFLPSPEGGTNDFLNVEAREYYKLSWTAYAIALEDRNTTTGIGNLVLYYNYQPWKGEQYDVIGKRTIIMEDISSFQFRPAGSLIKIQVCSKTPKYIKDGNYSLCKEKTVY